MSSRHNHAAQRVNKDRAEKHQASLESGDADYMRGRKKGNANAAFVEVRDCSLRLWIALVKSGVRPPFEGTMHDWIAQDRRREEQRRLAKVSIDPEVRKCERHYQQSLNTLMKEIDGLVWLYARRMSKYAAHVTLEVEDLVQEGLVGVMRAVETFDPQRGNVFNTYAHFWIYRAMRKAVQNAGIIRLPCSAKEADVKKLRIGRYIGDMSASGHTRPGWVDEQRGYSFEENTPDESPLQDEVLLAQQNDNLLVELLAKLATEDPKKFDVLISRMYGEKTFAQIGQEYGVCRERIRQINDAAIEKLQQLAKEKKHGLH